MDYVYVRFPQFKQKAVTMSYDDGFVYDKRLIAIMQKYGLKGTFNINAGLFKTEAGDMHPCRLTKEEACALYLDSGMEVAVHGYKHFSLGAIDGVLALNDVITDRKELEKAFGRIITGMAYANGSYSDEAVEILKKCGITYARTTVSTEKFDLPTDWLRLPATCHHNNPRLMELAKEFVEMPMPTYYWKNKPKLFYLWGHSHEFARDNNWEVIEQFAEYIGNRDDIWYATNGEICAYMQACERLQFSVDGDVVYNPSCIDVYIDFLGKQFLIHSGETIRLN